MQHPRAITKLRSFLGPCSLYRGLISGYANIAERLSKLLGKGVPTVFSAFGSENDQAFPVLIDSIATALVLALPRTGLASSVKTNASDYQFGAVMFQTHPNGQRKPAGFWSRSVSCHEKNFSTAEKSV